MCELCQTMDLTCLYVCVRIQIKGAVIMCTAACFKDKDCYFGKKSRL